MTPARWRQIREIFDSAVERSAEDRDAYLLTACQGDEALQAEVVSLIASLQCSKTDFLEHPAAGNLSLAESMADEMEGRQIGQDRKSVV